MSEEAFRGGSLVERMRLVVLTSKWSGCEEECPALMVLACSRETF